MCVFNFNTDYSLALDNGLRRALSVCCYFAKKCDRQPGQSTFETRFVRSMTCKIRPCSLLFFVMMSCTSCARERFILYQRESAFEIERGTDRVKVGEKE